MDLEEDGYAPPSPLALPPTAADSSGGVGAGGGGAMGRITGRLSIRAPGSPLRELRPSPLATAPFASALARSGAGASTIPRVPSGLRLGSPAMRGQEEGGRPK